MIKTTLTQISIEEFAERLKQAVLGEIKDSLRIRIEDPTQTFLKIEQACAFLQMSVPQLNKLRKEGKIKALKPSDKLVMFRKSDLIEYLTSSIQ